MKDFDAMFQEFRTVADRLRGELENCQRSSDPVALRVADCRALMRTLHSEYDRLGGQCGRMDAVMSPLHWEIMQYLDSLTDSEGEPKYANNTNGGH